MALDAHSETNLPLHLRANANANANAVPESSSERDVRLPPASPPSSPVLGDDGAYNVLGREGSPQI